MALQQFERWQLEQELADDLRKAYRGNAQLRATKVELLQKIDAIDKRLAKNTKAQEVLDDPKYAELEIRFDDGFLRKIEEQAASNVLKKRKQKGSEEDSGDKDSKSTMGVEQKTVWLLEFLQKSDHENLTVAQITDELQKQGITKGSSATQWLAPLKLPQKCVPWVQSGNRRKGKWFRWWHSADLKKRMEEFGVKPPKKDSKEE